MSQIETNHVAGGYIFNPTPAQENAAKRAIMADPTERRAFENISEATREGRAQRYALVRDKARQMFTQVGKYTSSNTQRGRAAWTSLQTTLNSARTKAQTEAENEVNKIYGKYVDEICDAPYKAAQKMSVYLNRTGSKNVCGNLTREQQEEYDEWLHQAQNRLESFKWKKKNTDYVATPGMCKNNKTPDQLTCNKYAKNPILRRNNEWYNIPGRAAGAAIGIGRNLGQAVLPKGYVPNEYAYKRQGSKSRSRNTRRSRSARP
jgi:hypothetical protein